MDFHTPVGRIVQGSVAMQAQKDMDTNQPLKNDDGSPVMGTFIALAFPKVLPNGERNAEFDQFFAMLGGVAAQSWPALFPQGGPQFPEYIKPGQQGACINPRFSYKYQDGDGVDSSGKSVASKPGFAGHHIVRFYTSYPVRCFHEGKFAAHEEIQKPEDIIKRGYWVRIFGEAKSNNASGTQVPGISLYPKLLSFVERGEEIVSGPDAEAAFGGAAVGWRPPASASPIPTGGAPAVAAPAVSVPTPAAAAPTVSVPTPAPAVTAPAINVPVPGAAPVVPTPPAAPAGPVVSAALAAQGITWAMLQGQGWTEETARQAGYIV